MEQLNTSISLKKSKKSKKQKAEQQLNQFGERTMLTVSASLHIQLFDHVRFIDCIFYYRKESRRDVPAASVPGVLPSIVGQPSGPNTCGAAAANQLLHKNRHFDVAQAAGMGVPGSATVEEEQEENNQVDSLSF
jgi:hypothetical protein